MAKYFKKSEFACKCKCGFNNWDTKDGQRFVRGLDRARGIAGIPFIITSGCRCPLYNESIGSKSTSSHLKIAADIRATSSTIKFIIVKALIEVGFTRIFLYHDRNIVHADMDETKPQPSLRAY